MADEPSAQEAVIGELALLVRPLAVLRTPKGTGALVRDLGWDFPAGDPFPGVPASIGQGLSSVATAHTGFRNATDDMQRFTKAADLLAAVRALLATLPNLGSQLKSALPASYQQFIDNSGIDTLLFRRLVDRLVMSYVNGRSRAAHDTAVLLGLFEEEAQQKDTQHFRREATVDKVHWERLPKLFSEPLQVADDLYGWNSSFDGELFLEHLSRALAAVGLETVVRPQAEKVADVLRRPLDDRDEHRVQIVATRSGGSFGQAGLALSPVPGDSTLDPGIAILPGVSGAATGTVKLTDTVSVKFTVTLGTSGGAVVVIRPPRRVSVAVNLLSTATENVEGELGVVITRAKPQRKETVIVGSPKASRLSMRELSVGISAGVEGQKKELSFLFSVKDLALVVAPGDGDGFLAKVLPPDGVRAASDMGIAISSVSGLHFTGSGGFEITLPVKTSLAGVVLIEAVHLGLHISGTAITAVVAVTGRVKLGPVAASVERVGIGGDYAASPGGGNLGAASTSSRFAPPKGVGMSVGTGPLGGGGYLYFDPAEEQYAGALQLDVKALSVKAVGLLTTRMPDGSKGFSLLLIITAEFQPIQLSFGFTLIGVGGLVGINRSVNLEAMRKALKDGSLDSVKFPKNVVAGAPRIISDLRAIFPVTPDQHVFGPMVVIGWGTPTLIRLELGLLLELPSPLRLYILGKLAAVLPKPEKADVVLQIDVLGLIDFDRGEASVDGTLVHSRIVQFPITGEFAGRANLGQKPAFAISVGGFNPRSERPPGFPDLAPLKLDFSQGDNPRITLQAYFALTPNTVQLGARAQLHAERDFGSVVGKFTLDAYAGFDALLRLPALEFVVDLGGGFTLKRNGADFCNVKLELVLTGPRPVHALGSATFEVLGLKRSIPVDISIGPSAPPPLPEPVDPAPLVLEQLKDPRNWTAILPGDDRMLVTLRQREASDTGVVVHPLGGVAVKQRVVPLGMQIDLFGHAPIADGALRSYVVEVKDSKTGAALGSNGVRDMFAPAEFLEMSDDERLSRPSFESMEAGRKLDAPAGAEGSSRARTSGYKTVIVAPQQPRAPQPGTYTPDAGVVLKLAHGGAAGRAEPRANGEPAFRGEMGSLRVAEPAYVIAGRSDMSVSALEPTTYAEAEAARRQAAAKSVTGRADTQVVGAHEVPA